MTETPPTGTQVAATPNPLWTGIKTVLKPLASLQLTVGLFALAIVLVFFGTLAQIENGISQVVQQYFWSYLVQIKFNLIADFAKVFVPGLKIGHFSGSFPFPAGKTIGGLMLLNLLAAHLVRFKISWKRTGIILIHSGVALMLMGEWITREKAVEQRMSIEEGTGSNYAFSLLSTELAFVDVTDPNDQTCAVVPFSLLKVGETIRDNRLPFAVEVVGAYANSDLTGRTSADDSPADTGQGLKYKIKPLDTANGLEDKVDLPSAYVRLFTKDGDKPKGTFLFSVLLANIGKTETIESAGRTYDVSLRFKRYYKPFTLFLKKFSFDRYLGTNTPKNYSSDVVLATPDRESERAVRIAMNDPLRYDGEAFYQADFDKETERTTVLQVVKNPGWLIPYISCVIVGLGMLVHFAITLPKKVAAVKWKSGGQTGRSAWDRYAPWASMGFVAIILVGAVAPLFVRPKPAAYDLTACGALPVVDGGRLKPLDTTARTTLRIVAAKESLEDGNKNNIPAIVWYLETIARSDKTYQLQTFRIDNEQVLNELKLKVRDGFRFSIDELKSSIQLIESRAMAAEAKKKDGKEPDLTEQKFVELFDRLRQYALLQARTGPLVIPPEKPGGKWESFQTVNEREMQAAETDVWKKLGSPPQNLANAPKNIQDTFEKLLDAEMQTRLEKEPALKAWWDIAAFYRNQKPEEFNAAVAKAKELADAALTPGNRTRIAVETVYNRVSPLFWTIGLYVFGFVLSTIAVLGAGWARKSALWVVGLTFAVHTLALFTRIYLQGRPPVTNLYSSAVFIGWGCVGLGLLLERVFKGGYAIFAGSVLGFLTTLLAHNLDKGEGDSLEMMRAVLDTNFWLATHVTCITLGYVATGFCGILGIIYVVQAVFLPTFDRNRERSLATLAYVVLCLATLLSFVGTVLGGIWADQSWGRFWGWDPKENGALLIVVWNALILHARWGGMVKQRGMAVLTIVGNMVTLWSWFGTNQLSVGLHNYGFMSSAVFYLGGFVLAQLGLVLIGLIPRRFWRSASAPAARPEHAPA
ncbi:MAG TPA: cytochrome c biogenesis protein CcsA, partial [Fimbriiglobus sp.]